MLQADNALAQLTTASFLVQVLLAACRIHVYARMPIAVSEPRIMIILCQHSRQITLCCCGARLCVVHLMYPSTVDT
jgi:hypothetical protein